MKWALISAIIIWDQCRAGLPLKDRIGMCSLYWVLQSLVGSPVESVMTLKSRASEWVWSSPASQAKNLSKPLCFIDENMIFVLWGYEMGAGF